MKTNLNVQKVNARVGQRQFRVTFVTKIVTHRHGEEEAIDRWAVIEATGRIKTFLAARIWKVVGKCKIL